MEVRQWRACSGYSVAGSSSTSNDNSSNSSSSTGPVQYSIIQGAEKMLQLDFTQPLQMKRGWPRRPVAVVAGIRVRLAACSEHGRTCIKLQQVEACLQPADAPSGPSRAVSALVLRGGLLLDVTVSFSAKSPAAGSCGPILREFSTLNPAMTYTRGAIFGNADDDYYRCDTPGFLLPCAHYCMMQVTAYQVHGLKLMFELQSSFAASRRPEFSTLNSLLS